MKKILETERLYLREFTTDDKEFIFELLNSPGWIKYIGDRGIKTLDNTINYINEGLIRSYKINGFGLWGIVEKESDILVGMCGLLKRDYLEDVDVGFALLPSHEGLGYGKESALETVRYAKNELTLKTLAAITVPYNDSSIRLLQKLGFNFCENIRIPNDDEELMLFKISL